MFAASPEISTFSRPVEQCTSVWVNSFGRRRQVVHPMREQTSLNARIWAVAGVSLVAAAGPGSGALAQLPVQTPTVGVPVPVPTVPAIPVPRRPRLL